MSAVTVSSLIFIDLSCSLWGWLNRRDYGNYSSHYAHPARQEYKRLPVAHRLGVSVPQDLEI